MKYDSIEEKVLYNYLLNNSMKQGLNYDPANSNGILKDMYTGVKMPDEKLVQMDLYWNEMDCTKTNWSYRILPQGKNIIEKGKIFIKKVTRRFLRWYIDPICVQQTSFNSSVTRLAGAQLEILHYYQNQMVQLANDLNESRAKQMEMAKVIESMENKYDKKIEDMVMRLEESNRTTNSYDEKIENMIMQLEKSNQMRKIEDENRIASLTKESIWKFNNIFFQQAVSVSQAGEDRILATLLFSTGKRFEDCSYIDIGANHPIELSNTYYFYKLGAQGVLLEANPNLIPELQQVRPRDIILNRCMSVDQAEEVEFFVMNKDGLSTTDRSNAEKLLKSDPHLEIIETFRIKTISINEIIEKVLQKVPTILNIDIEGIESEILQQLDFDKYRPYVIVVENIEINTKLIENEKNKHLNEFMDKVGYSEYAFTGINSIFIDKSRG